MVMVPVSLFTMSLWISLWCSRVIDRILSICTTSSRFRCTLSGGPTSFGCICQIWSQHLSVDSSEFVDIDHQLQSYLSGELGAAINESIRISGMSFDSAASSSGSAIRRLAMNAIGKRSLIWRTHAMGAGMGWGVYSPIVLLFR